MKIQEAEKNLQREKFYSQVPIHLTLKKTPKQVKKICISA